MVYRNLERHKKIDPIDQEMKMFEEENKKRIDPLDNETIDIMKN